MEATAWASARPIELKSGTQLGEPRGPLVCGLSGIRRCSGIEFGGLLGLEVSDYALRMVGTEEMPLLPPSRYAVLIFDACNSTFNQATTEGLCQGRNESPGLLIRKQSALT